MSDKVARGGSSRAVRAARGATWFLLAGALLCAACGARTEGPGDGGDDESAPRNVKDPPRGTAGAAGSSTGTSGAAGMPQATPVCIPGVSPGSGATQLLCMSASKCPAMTDPSLFGSLGSTLCKPGCILAGPMNNTGPGACCYLATLKCN